MPIGVDLVDCSRFARILEVRRRFKDIVFTAREIADAEAVGEQQRNEFLAGRFAVKEAVMKALRTGMTGCVKFTDIETRRTESGAPDLHLDGEAKRVAFELGISRADVSISHDGGFVVAFVLLT